MAEPSVIVKSGQTQNTSNNSFTPLENNTTWREGNLQFTYTYEGTPGQPEDINKHVVTVYGPGITTGTTVTGHQALDLVKSHRGTGRLYPDRGFPYSPGTNDYRSTFSYQIGSGLRKSFTDPNRPTAFGRLFNTPVTATLGGAGIGLGLGVLGSWLGKRLRLVDKDTDTLWPGLLGAAAGAGLGYLSNKYSLFSNQSLPEFMQKKSSMWQDPRNFLLEKLQRANDINAIDKAILAGKIRSMDSYSATNLEKLVRGALGIGVGAIIAKFFGLGAMGTIFSSLGGIYAMNAAGVGNSFFR